MHQAQWVQRAKRVLLVRLVHQAQMVTQASLVPPVRLVPWVHLVQLALQATQVPRASLACQVTQANPVEKVL